MQLIGIPLALLMGLFFWVGSQSFNDPNERMFANGMLVYCIALLATSFGSLGALSLRRLNATLTLGALAILGAGWIYAEVISDYFPHPPRSVPDARLDGRQPSLG